MSLTPPTAEEIKAFRRHAAYSQVLLAEALGVSRRTVEGWESGQNGAPAYLRLALAALDAGLAPWAGG